MPEALRPIIRLVSSSNTCFPSGSSVRSLILYKIIDVLYIIGLRLGFEMTRRLMTSLLKAFFKPFEQVYSTGIEGCIPHNTSSGDLRESLYSGSAKGRFLRAWSKGYRYKMLHIYLGCWRKLECFVNHKF